MITLIIVLFIVASIVAYFCATKGNLIDYFSVTEEDVEGELSNLEVGFVITWITMFLFILFVLLVKLWQFF